MICVAESTVAVAGGGAELDRRGAGEVRAGDGHRGAAGRRPGRRADGRDRRGRRVGELVGRRGGRGAAGRGHRDVDRAGVPAGLVAVICVAESP